MFQRKRSWAPDLEGMERRELLSGLPSRPPAASVSAQDVRQNGPDSATIRTIATSGEIRKRPAFSVDYLGPRRENLNLVEASAVLRPGQTLTLTATTATPINLRPATAGVEDASFFVFGLKRGPAATALFPTRPGIRFDAVVVIGITPSGVSGYVQDIARGNVVTTFDPARISFRGRTARVTIPTNLLPGADGASNLRFAVWARSRLEHGLADIDDFVASFLPENRTAAVRKAGRPR